MPDSLARRAVIAALGGAGEFTVGSRISTEDRKMWSAVKAMPSVWKVGKFSFSLRDGCAADGRRREDCREDATGVSCAHGRASR